MALIIEPSPNMSVSRNPVDYDYRLTIMSYDARGRVEAIMKWNDNTGFDMVHYIYNSMNQVVTVTAADALYKFMIWNEYDDNGRLHRVYTKKGELNSGLFENGNIHFDDLRFPYPFWTGDPDGGFPVNEPAVEYEYNERGSVSKIKYFGFGADEDVVIQKEIIYNPRGWVDQLTIREMVTSPVVLFSQAFERNSIGNITKQTSNRNGYDELVQDYTYDRLNRLIEWDESKYGTNEKYSYDKIGNRTSHEINNMTMRDYVYNPDTNRLNYFYFEDENFDQHSTSYTYNNIGQMLTRLKSFNSDTISHEGYKYNTAGRLVEYTKSNISGFGSSFNQSLLPHESFTADKWTYGYKYNHAGVREQKRMLTSPHGDGDIDDEGIKVFAHLWEYYMTGAFGEEIVQYKGFQTSADVGMGPERKVYLGAYRYRAGGELLYHHDGTKEVAFTDNNGSVRLVVRQNGTAFDTLHFDYKPFGDTLWTSAGTMNRDNFNGSTYDAESDLQMMGFRMYDNETGRFTTPDLLWSAFPAQTPYHYAFNSPLTYRDPTGLAPEKEKEREELQHMITLNDLIIGNLIYAAFISAIKSSSVYSPSAIPDGRRDEVDKLIYISARTASASYSFNGVSISMGFDGKPAGVFFNYTLQITVDKKVLNMPVSIAVDKSDGKHLFKIKETMDGYMNNLKASAMKILSADISYFDPMMGGNYNIIIESGAKIAKFHNSENGKNFTHLAGLHTSHGDNSATFRLAKEVFKDGGDKDYRYTNEFGRGSRLQVWDTFAHEVAHELDLLNYGRELYDHSGIIGDVAKEIFAERRVNWLRFLSNKPRSIYP
ncbi:MAG: hypothetical protein KIT33_01380 [Candidatus Kapabacteria bacterium]|nr:hypothetical protein [Candidatus Kapabacteria bacterium]